MTLTETLSFLRQIQAQWSATDIPAEKLAALEAACLVETRSEPAPAVRLTPTGERCKAIAQSHHMESTAAAKPKAKAFHMRHKRNVMPARALV